MRHPIPVLASAIVVLGVVGCGGSDGPPDLASYFEARPYSNPACNAVDDQLAGQREMRLYVNGNAAMLPVTQGVARYYHRHSLSFFTQEQPQATTMAYALDTNSLALTVELTKQFPGVDLSDAAALMADPVLWDQILAVVANFILKPMVDFAATHSDGGAAVTNLLVIPNLERPGGEPLGNPGEQLAGLAISPPLLVEFARTMTEESRIWQGVNLPADFTPMMVLSHNVIQQVNGAPDLKDILASHEFGHTGALIHSAVQRNLMYPGVSIGIDGCTNSLDDAQLGIMRATLGVGAAAATSALTAASAAGAPRATQPARKPAFTPDSLRAMLGGDRRAMRSFVEFLFHGAAYQGSVTGAAK